MPTPRKVPRWILPVTLVALCLALTLWIGRRYFTYMRVMDEVMKEHGIEYP